MKIQKSRRSIFIVLLSIVLIVGAQGVFATGQQEVQKADKDGKVPLTLMFKWADDSLAEYEEQMVAEHFKDKYDITFKQVDMNIERILKTTITAGQPVDLAFYWTTNMKTFVDAGMALDLTPYLDVDGGAWKNTFVKGSLTPGTHDGKVYAVPATPVYPMVLANKDLLDKAGVILTDSPSWDEFKAAMATIKEKLGISPFGISNSWSNWPVRSNLKSVWPTLEEAAAFGRGEISFNDPSVIKAFDEAKSIYDNDYAYPGGPGAMAVTLDQVSAGFRNGDIAMIAYINFLATTEVKNSGLENIQVLSFPHMGDRDMVMGSANGYMIPANVKNPEASIEILQFLTSREVLKNRMDNGSPIAVTGVDSDNEMAVKFGKDGGKLYTIAEIDQLSNKINEYFTNQIPANYIFNPERTLKELEALRLEVSK